MNMLMTVKKFRGYCAEKATWEKASRWPVRGVGGRRTKKKKENPAGWPRRLSLIRATSRAEVDVIGAQLYSCARAIFPSQTLSWSTRSLPLIIVDNCPHMHNTGFFPNCSLLSATNGSIWIPYLARYSEIFKKPNLQVVKWKSTFIWKILSQAELETEGSCLSTIFGSPPTPRLGRVPGLGQITWWIVMTKKI